MTTKRLILAVDLNDGIADITDVLTFVASHWPTARVTFPPVIERTVADGNYGPLSLVVEGAILIEAAAS